MYYVTTITTYCLLLTGMYFKGGFWLITEKSNMEQWSPLAVWFSYRLLIVLDSQIRWVMPAALPGGLRTLSFMVTWLPHMVDRTRGIVLHAAARTQDNSAAYIRGDWGIKTQLITLERYKFLIGVSLFDFMHFCRLEVTSMKSCSIQMFFIFLQLRIMLALEVMVYQIIISKKRVNNTNFRGEHVYYRTTGIFSLSQLGHWPAL